MRTYNKICKICGKPFVATNYQTEICADKHYGKCYICGGPVDLSIGVRASKYLNGQPITCSRKCAGLFAKQTAEHNNSEDPNNVKKAKQTRLSKYNGHYEPNKSKEKRRQTVQTRYNRNCSIDLEKRRQTMIQRYGSENYNNREQAKQTCIEKYGVDNPRKSKEIIDKIWNTYYERTGYTHNFRNPDSVNRSRQTKLKNHGNPVFVNPEKTKQTKLKKYGTLAPLSAINKARETKRNIYGYTYYNLNKARETMLEKYGVPYYVMTEECRQKAHTTISQVNLKFKNKLEKIGLDVDMEFVIGEYQYDLKVDNTLIEIDPTFTHNSTFAPAFSKDNIGKPRYR